MLVFLSLSSRLALQVVSEISFMLLQNCFVYILFKIQTFEPYLSAAFAVTLWAPSFFPGNFLPKCLLIA